jgi:cytochrome c553
MMRLYSYMLVIGVFFSIGCSERIDAPAPVAELPDSPWVLNEVTDVDDAELYAACASCHMADASGRSDGLVPRLAGQLEKVLIHKLQKLRDGTVTLPVMVPFARALTPVEVTQVAHYIATLPSPKSGVALNKNYATYCASCHGEEGQGNDVFLAPKLCGQHEQYLSRRMIEITQNLRGDADMGMVAMLNTMEQSTRDDIAQWLAVGQCKSTTEKTEKHNEQ